MSARKLLFFASIVLSYIFIGGLVFFLSSNLLKEKEQNKILSSEIVVKNDANIKELSVLALEIDDLKLKVDNLSSENEALNSSLATEKDKRIAAERLIRELESKIMCEGQISWNVDYSNAGTVHQSLLRWVEEDENVVRSDYRTLYNNSKISWHELRGNEYAYYYVVFYDEDNYYKNGIYSVGCQGYVD